MPRIDKNATLEDLIDLFREAVTYKNLGFKQDNRKMEREGGRRQAAVMKRIDQFGELGRRAMVVLMNADPDQGVRVWAAGELMYDRPELAIPVLKDIEKNGSVWYDGAAWGLLMRHEIRTQNPDIPAAIDAAKRRAALAEAAARYEAETASRRTLNVIGPPSKPN